MAWSAVPTFVSGNVLTAAQQNILGGNLNETAVALATGAGQYPVASGTNALVMRTASAAIQDVVTTSSSTSPIGSLPQITTNTSSQALVALYSYMNNNTNSETSYFGFDLSGATTAAALENRAIAAARFTSDFAFTASGVFLANTTAGSNIFTCKRWVTGGTGTWDHMRLVVMPF